MEAGRPSAVEPSSMARRLTDVRPILAALVALPLLVACSSAQTPQAAPNGVEHL